MTSRERLLATFAGRPVDRVPVSLYEFDGYYDGWIHDQPEYARILACVRGKTDKLRHWAPPAGRPTLFLGEIPPESVTTETWRGGTSRFCRTTVRTPGGELTSLRRMDEGIQTWWTVERFCKTPSDALAVLSLPRTPWRPDLSSFAERDRETGDEGILMGDVADALCMTVELFGFSRFLLLVADEPGLVFRLMEFFQERILAYVGHLLAGGATTVYRIVGPEYATPPYLSPAMFERLVAPFDTELIRLLHRHGAVARVHCHGRVRRVAASLGAMGADAVDPCEPPPDGDATLAELRGILGDRVVLIGNIEERLFEMGTPEQIDRAVATAVAEGAAGGPFILCPTAMPLTTPLPPRVADNILRYVDCGLRYGAR